MPIHLTEQEHLRRKKATALDFTVKKDAKGNVLNPEVVSKTSQSFKEDCDINKIIAKCIKGNGQLPVSTRQPRYGDFTNVGDFQTALMRINQMKDEFAALDAEVRAKFHNDPAELVAFINDPKNEDEAVKLGILPKPKWDFKTEEGPNGSKFHVTYKNGVEISRKPVESAPIPPGTGK